MFPRAQAQPCCAWAQALVDQVRSSAYPEISGSEISVRSLNSASDYFQARFEWRRFFTGRRMRYVILFNPRLLSLNAPEPGAQAIVAHELAHIARYRSGNRLRLLGLARLLAAGPRARFERGADREAIRRGFGPGLKEYRLWLYKNVPPTAIPGKLRDYLSPDEIEAILLLGLNPPGGGRGPVE